MRKLLLAGVVLLSLGAPAMADTNVNDTLQRLHDKLALMPPPTEEEKLVRQRAEQQYHCDNVTKPQITESLEHSVYMLDRNAKVLDMTIEFEPLLGICFSHVITDHAGSFMLYYGFVTMNGKGYIQIKRVGP